MGKSHLVQAIGHQACVLGWRVRYTTSAELLEDLEELPELDLTGFEPRDLASLRLEPLTQVLEPVPEAGLDDAGLALARRVALLPHNQAQMMKLLVNQAFEQMGLHTTQLIGTLLDGAARHTPEGVAFTRRGLEDVRAAVADRDAPFGDYGQGRKTV